MKAFFRSFCLVAIALAGHTFAAGLPPAKDAAADFPNVVWKNRLDDDDLWSKGGWQREGKDLLIAKSQAFCAFPEKLTDAAIRVRFHYDGPGGSFIDLILRGDGKASNVRYVATNFIGKDPDHLLGVDVRFKDDAGNHGSIGGAGRLASLKPGDEHTLEFYALGGHLAYYLDGTLAASFHDTKLTTGQTALFTGSQLHFTSVETADLSQRTLLAAISPAPKVASTPPAVVAPAATPPTVALPATTPRPATPANLPHGLTLPPLPPRNTPPSSPFAAAMGRATPAPIPNLYEIKSILRVTKLRGYMDNGWKGSVPCIQAEVRVTRELTKEKPYAHAYFFDHEYKLIQSFKGPIQVSDDQINYTSMPAFFKPHQNSKVCFPITEAANQPGHRWSHVVIVFGDATKAAAESLPKEDLSKFDFPERDIALDASATALGSNVTR